MKRGWFIVERPNKKLDELRRFFDDWKAKEPQAIEAHFKGIPKEIRDKFDDFTIFTSLNIMALRERENTIRYLKDESRIDGTG